VSDKYEFIDAEYATSTANAMDLSVLA